MAEKCGINIEATSYSPTVETDDYVNVDTNNPIINQQVTKHHIRSYDCIESISTDFSKCNLMKCVQDSVENEDDKNVDQIKENQENNNEEEREELEVDENGNDDLMSEIQDDTHERHLETPVGKNTFTSDQNVNKSNLVKPLRLSDEFFSAEEEELINRKIELIEKNKFINDVVSIRVQRNLRNNYKSVEKAACSSNLNNIVDTNNIDIESQSNEVDNNPSASVVTGFSGEDNTLSCSLIDINKAIGVTTENIPNVVQSLDAIECEDYKNELKLTNGILIRNSSLISNKNRLNLDLANTFKENETTSKKKVRSDDDIETDDLNILCKEKSEECSKDTNSKTDLTTTPTSSRYHNNCRGSGFLKKSATKLNLDIFEDSQAEHNENEIAASSSSSGHEGLSQCARIKLNSKLDSFLNANSNDSLSSDKSYIISNMRNNSSFNHKDDAIVNNGASSSKGSSECNKKKSEKPKLSPESCDIEDKIELKDNTANVLPSTSSSSSSFFNPSYNCHFSEFNKTEANSYNEEPNENKNGNGEIITDNFPSASSNFANVHEIPISSSSSSTTSSSNRNSNPQTIAITSVGRLLKNEFRKCPKNFGNDENELINGMGISLSHMEAEHDCDEEWADCEEGSDSEEICTCIDYSYDYGLASSEDELPSRDVDLSVYTPHMDTISDDMLQENNACTAETPRLHRKRKLTESRLLFGDSPISDSINNLNSNRKRLALENSSASPRSLLTPSILNMSTTTTPTSIIYLGERRTPRSIIPTKDNPPPELNEWLIQFQRWSHAERLLAVDRLIDHCEPTQVRHMMKVIEPQFQRDFISLLPKELALQVLSFLEPKDLLRAAQTCRSWRFLADDNLLWKEKCKVTGIIMETTSDRPKRGRAGNMPPISSAWKAAYIRQHTIEMNWRSRPVRKPKTLKGHDDHVITCLQFCGNRIVSGSDDNTLKVWSAITGKCLRTLVGHTGGVWSSQMSGNVIISGSTDRTLKVWSADTGQCVHTLYGHTSTVRCMHLHGNKVVSGSRDATLRVWDVNEGTCLHVLVGHLAAVRCVQYDGKLVVSGAYDYMVKVWNPERQECLHTLQGHTNRVYSLQFDGVHVVSGSLDTSIRVWEAETGSCKHTLMGHQSLTSGMELRQNILVSGNADSTVKVWDIITGQCLQTLSGPNKHQSAVTCLQFNTRFVITSSDDGTVKLWDVKTGDFIRNMVALDSGGSGGVVWRIRANDTKLICAVGSRNGTEETKLMVLDFDVEGACLKCS